MVQIELLGRIFLTLLRIIVFGLTLGITIISFQAYQKQRTKRLQYAFFGFAFISMGIALDTVITQFGSDAGSRLLLFFDTVQTLPFIIGFSMLYLSLYR